MGDSLLLNHLPQQLANGLTLGAVYSISRVERGERRS